MFFSLLIQPGCNCRLYFFYCRREALTSRHFISLPQHVFKCTSFSVAASLLILRCARCRNRKSTFACIMRLIRCLSSRRGSALAHGIVLDIMIRTPRSGAHESSHRPRSSFDERVTFYKFINNYCRNRKTARVECAPKVDQFPGGACVCVCAFKL
jgi:hypothetical protein